MPRLTATDDDTVFACPECDEPGIWRRVSESRDDTFACHADGCQYTGDRCIVRDRLEDCAMGGPNPTDPAYALVEMSPAEFEREVLRG